MNWGATLIYPHMHTFFLLVLPPRLFLSSSSQLTLLLFDSHTDRSNSILGWGDDVDLCGLVIATQDDIDIHPIPILALFSVP